MKRIQKFKDFYNSDLVPELNRIEASRKNLTNQIIALIVVMSVVFPLSAYYLIDNNKEEPIYLLFFIPVFGLIAIGFYIIYESLLKSTNFYKDYKKDIIYRIIKFINPTLRYDKKNFVSKTEYINSGFFPKELVKVDGDDHVTGTIDDVNIEFSELKVSYKRRSEREKYRKDNQFHGIFFVADCPNPFPSDLIIEPKNQEISGTDVLLPIKNTEFNEYFRVRLPSRDYFAQAQEMMSDEFVKKVLSIRHEIHNEVHISFIYNKMYVGIVHDKDLFEPSLWHPVTNFDHLWLHFKDLFVPISIIETLAAHQEFELIPDEREKAAKVI